MGMRTTDHGILPRGLERAGGFGWFACLVRWELELERELRLFSFGKGKHRSGRGE
jgi:hypothetical protein